MTHPRCSLGPLLVVMLYLTGIISLSDVMPLAISSAMAQVVSPLTSSGLNTQISGPIAGPGGTRQFNITGGTRPANGPNLFHSFGNFSVPTNNVANFLNDAGLPTTNILARVTGGNVSSIFGTIQTTGFGNANLFLMNPAGFLFGPTATLNVGGMVTFTSADYLRFLDQTKFNAAANPAADALLSIAPVAAFGFLGSNPGAITVQGSQLSVAPGQGLSFVGGDITIEGATLAPNNVQPARLAAPGGHLALISVASPGEVRPVSAGGQPAEPAGIGFTKFGTITLAQGAILDTSADAAGRIVIRGGQFTMTDASIKAISVNGTGPANASPTISITAEAVELQNGAYITADTLGTAPAGDITFNVGTLTTQAGGNRIPLNPNDNDIVAGNLIASDSRSVNANAGPAGNITIQGIDGPGTAATSVLLRDSSISSRIFGGSPGATRSAITITADSLVLTNEGLPGGGGAATIVANTIGPAPAGNIALNVNTLLANVNADETPIEGARKVFIVTSNNPGSTAGPTGNITISGIRPESTDAANLVALNNIAISAGADGGTATTPPGNITITTDTLSLANDAGILTATFGEGPPPAGTIAINVNTLRAQIRPDGTPVNGLPQSFLASVSLSGQAGDITISGIGPEATDAAKLLALNNLELNTVVFGGNTTTRPAAIMVTADTIQLTNSNNIKTNTNGAAPAGNIAFNATTFSADQGTKISSGTSGPGPGGTISITAGQSVTLNNGSAITASSTGPADAGDITINAGRTFTSTNSSLTTEAAQASGGNITVLATDSVRLTNSQLNASVQGSSTTIGGNIVIDPQTVILQNSQLVANATQGQGGNISITTQSFLADATSVIDASSQFGVSGTVNIQSPTSQMAGRLVALPNNPLTATPLLSQRCAALAHSGESSSFVVAGRDSLPPEPGGWLPSPMTLDTKIASLAAKEAPRVSIRRRPIAAAAPQIALHDWIGGCGS
ncbi:MAG: filamentous hemagglutinin N-terminal domain-containing protein [Nitrospiraceae bacterium]